MGTWYYTSCCIQKHCQMHFIARSQIYSEVHSWLHLIVHSQPAWRTLQSKFTRHCQVHCEYPPKDTSAYVLTYMPGHALKGAPKCTRWHTPSLLDLHSRVSSQDTLKYTPSTFSSTLLGMLSRTLPIALSGTLPACLTIHSQVSSQDAPKYSPSMLPSTPPSMFSSTLLGMLPRTLPIALDGTLPTCLTVRSQ